MATNGKPAVSDLKKRAFEALERRFSAAKAELENQQKDKKRCPDEKEQIPNKHSSSISSPKLKSSSLAPSSMKGQFASPDHIHLQRTSQGADEEASGPTYFLLSQPVHANLLPTSNELSSKRGSIGDKIVHELLLSGDSAQKYMHGSRSMKIDNWLLLDSLVQGQGASKGAFMRATTSHSKCSKSHVSMQQHRKFGSLDLPREFHDFNLFKPMHEMWKGYILQLIKNNGKGQLSHCLLSADLHGAILQVVQCKIPAFTGACGIMIRETKETFGLITQDNQFQGFCFYISSWLLEDYPARRQTFFEECGHLIQFDVSNLDSVYTITPNVDGESWEQWKVEMLSSHVLDQSLISQVAASAGPNKKKLPQGYQTR